MPQDRGRGWGSADGLVQGLRPLEGTFLSQTGAEASSYSLANTTHQAH
jgi:hypothetical protein